MDTVSSCKTAIDEHAGSEDAQSCRVQQVSALNPRMASQWRHTNHALNHHNCVARPTRPSTASACVCAAQVVLAMSALAFVSSILAVLSIALAFWVRTGLVRGFTIARLFCVLTG